LWSIWKAACSEDGFITEKNDRLQPVGFLEQVKGVGCVLLRKTEDASALPHNPPDCGI